MTRGARWRRTLIAVAINGAAYTVGLLILLAIAAVFTGEKFGDAVPGGTGVVTALTTIAGVRAYLSDGNDDDESTASSGHTAPGGDAGDPRRPDGDDDEPDRH